MVTAPVGRVSFRLDFYTDAHRWRGRIQHVLSRETAVFDPGDQSVLAGFIERHLPPLTGHVQAEACRDDESSRRTPSPGPGWRPLTVCFRVQGADGGAPTHVVSPRQPFQLAYEFSSDDEDVWDSGLRCDLEVFARAISGGEVWRLHSGSLCLDREVRRGAIRLVSPTTEGNYRLALVARVKDRSGEVHSVAGSWDHGIVAVL